MDSPSASSVRRTLRADLIQSVQNLGNHGRATKKGSNFKDMEVSIVMGVPLVIIHFLGWIFHYKPTSYWGSPMTLETPYGYKEPAPMESTFKIWCNWIWMNIGIREMNVQWKPHVQTWDPLPCCSTCGTVGFSRTPASCELWKWQSPFLVHTKTAGIYMDLDGI